MQDNNEGLTEAQQQKLTQVFKQVPAEVLQGGSRIIDVRFYQTEEDVLNNTVSCAVFYLSAKTEADEKV